MASGVLEVGGVPPRAEEELVLLYFESRRHSGGGPVRGCQRLGPLLFLTFEDPRDAQNVLSRGPHWLGGCELGVRAAPPWDPTHLLLGGVGPQPPPPELLETLLGRPPGTVTLCRDPPPGWALLRLRDPLSTQELAAAAQRARCRGPSGAAWALLRAPQTPSVLVRAAAPLSRPLLELYFENRRSGGGPVQAVRLLPGAGAAIVTFQQPAAAERVLRRPHRLQDVVLELSPHYPFLEAPDGDAVTPADAATPTDAGTPPDMVTPPDTDPPRAVAPQPHVGPPVVSPTPDTAPALGTGTPDPTGTPAHAEPAAMGPVTGEPLAAFPGEPGQPGDAEAASGWDPHWEHAVPAALAQDEVVVPAEPGALRYLQRHYQDLLGSIPEVTLLPLDGGDITGLRVRGESSRCQAAAEFVQSLLGSVAAQAVTLRLPGVARFLRDAGGQSVLRRLETQHQCVIQLDGARWSPPDPQTDPDDLLPPDYDQDPPPPPPPPDAQDLLDDADGADGTGLHPNIEEIKQLLAVLRTDAGQPAPPADHDPEEPTGEPPAPAVPEDEEDEEAQMVLAIQRSMESTRREDEELARATALSLRSYSRERHRGGGQEEEEEEEGGEGPGEEADAVLLAALEASLEEALPAADAALVTVFSSSEGDAASARRALELALAGRLRDEEVASERLRVLPARCRRRLTALQRKHAVRLRLRAGTATLSGFAEYTAAAAAELDLLLRRLPQPEGSGSGAGTACWVRWDPSGTAVPYAAEASALLERAWLRRERRLDLLLDGRPFTVDLERMEEYDIGNASTMPVSRSQPPADSAHQLLGLEALGQEEEVRLMVLPEDSEEFGDTVRHFYDTLEEQRGQIDVIKVQKLIHPLLYEQYRLKKASMERAGGAAERVLFHGTTETSSREICLHGFNRSFCGKNAALYGLGVYFAARAALSAQDRYSPPGADGTKFIFVAKVLTGRAGPGAPGLRAPPPLPRDAGPPRRYDSAADDPRRPGIFVIFNDTQAYPQYLIACRRRGGTPGTPPTAPSERAALGGEGLGGP